MKRRKRVGIVQSNYIPWKGYFDLINSVDEFILFDDVQYTRRDWRNRNKIKTPQGAAWLTIPVQVTGRYFQKIKDTEISEPDWAQSHWSKIEQNYRGAGAFKQFKPIIEPLYLGAESKLLSEVNYRFIKAICEILGIKTKLTWSMDYKIEGDPTERLVSLCKQAGATEYLSGPTAKSYLKEDLFQQESMALRFMDYSGYPEYRQLHPPFDHFVSVLDLIFNQGYDASKYMLSFEAIEERKAA